MNTDSQGLTPASQATKSYVKWKRLIGIRPTLPPDCSWTAPEAAQPAGTTAQT